MRRTREPMAENALLGSLQRSPPSPVDCYRPPTAGQSHPPPICSTSTGTYLPVESRPAAATCASGQERRDRSRRQRRARMPARVGVPRRPVAGDGHTAKLELMGPREWLAIAKSRWQRSARAGRWSPAGPSSIEAPSTSPWPPAAAAPGATSVVAMVGEVCAFLEQQAAPLAVETRL